MSVNKVFLRGHVGKDPIAYSDGKIVKLSLAVSNRYTDANGQKQDRTDWVSCVAFGKTGEYIMAKVRKGDLLSVDEGRLSTRTYENKAGTKVSETSVVIHEWQVFPKSEKRVADQPSFDEPSFDPDEPIYF